MNLPPCTECGAPAAWTCAQCGAKCASHVRRRRGPRISYRCDIDRAAAELECRPRSELHPLIGRVRRALLGPVAEPRLLLATVLGALLFASAHFLGFIGAALALAWTLVVGLTLARQVAEGEAFDWPAPADAMEQLAMPLARALAATLVPGVVLFVGVQVMVVNPYDADLHRRTLALALATHPAFWVATSFAVATVPLMLLHALRHDGFGTVLNPAGALLPIGRFPREYGWLSLFAGAGFLATFGVTWAMPFAHPIATALVGGLVGSYASYATFRLVGELAWLHPEELGTPGAGDGLEDLDDPAKPLMEDESAPTPPLSPDAPALAPAPPSEAQLLAALDHKDVGAAVDCYRSLVQANTPLAPATLLRAGQAAASANELALALKALLAAGRTDSPEASKALVIAARVMDERLRDADGARRLYQQTIQRFPGSQAADYATRQLADPRFLVAK